MNTRETNPQNDDKAPAPERIDDTIHFQARGFFHISADAKRRLTDGKTSQPQSFALDFRGLGAEPTNKHFAKLIKFALLAALIPNSE